MDEMTWGVYQRYQTSGGVADHGNHRKSGICPLGSKRHQAREQLAVVHVACRDTSSGDTGGHASTRRAFRIA